MSDDTIDDGFEDSPKESDSELVRNLRKQRDAFKKQAEASAAQLAERDKALRSQTVAETLTKKGARPELAKFYPTDGDGSEDSVNAWITENAELFGIDTSEGADAETVANAQAVSAITGNAPQGLAAGSNAFIAHKLATASDAELIQLGLLRKP